jgi:hypothetical protein
MSSRVSEGIDGPGETIMDIALPWALFRLGEAIRGHVNLTPVDPRAYADLAVYWECAGRLTLRTQGPIIQLARRIRLRIGVTVAVPFELPLPTDEPTTRTGAASAWFVVARLDYTGSPSGSAERVRCPITVVAHR